ncbi:trinucleotide repeat-containing gene 6C protein-like isoform X2 [Haliotis asinina]|uniref:trinucleotide repeat-containing gene 6C protein-like isoform X2 n=1 Tax=Haliotis asinina TaxID=109174 RepID=UPI0035322786
MQEGGKKAGNQWASSASAAGGLGWCEEDDGGWREGPPATGSGWTDPNKEAWPSIGNSETAGSDAGDDAASVKSGSVISSSSSHGQNQETNQGLSAMQSQSASNPWGANSTLGGLESNPWGIRDPPNSSAANMNPMNWGSSNPHPSLSMNNQGHNMQVGTSMAGSDNLSNSMNSNSSTSRSGWGMGAPGQGSPRPQNSMQMQTSNGNNMHGLMLSGSGAQQSGPPVSGNQTGPSNNQTPWQGSSGSGMFGGMTTYSKPHESGWNNPTSAVMNNCGKENSGNNGGPEGAGNGSSMWGTPDAPPKSGFLGSSGWGESLPPTPQSATQWDNNSKSQWGDNPNGAANSQGSGNTTEFISWAQAACKGLTPGSSNSGTGQPSAADAAGQSGQVADDFIRQAIENHDGWGAKPVKQDTAWDVSESPKTKRKFSTDSGGGASNVWNNNNGTAIWEASRDSSSGGNGGNGGNGGSGGSGGWNGASGGSQWQSENDSNTWNGPPNKPGADNQWGGNGGSGVGSGVGVGPNGGLGGLGGNSAGSVGVGGNGAGNVGGSGGGSSDKTIGTWGGGSETSSMWGNKTETGSWGSSGQDRDRGSGSQWGDNQDSQGGWEDAAMQRRRVDNGTGYWGEPQMQRPQGWNSQPSTPATPLTPRPKPEQPESWNKGAQVPVQQPPTGSGMGGGNIGVGNPPKASGWGDLSNSNMKVDDGTSIWAANAQQQARAGGWGDPGSQWNPTPGAKPKSLSTSSWSGDGGGGGGGDQNWNLRKGPNKFPTGNNHHPQMRSKLLQQLMDMGFKKEEAQNALISNNMNVESALADLMANKKDADMDVFNSAKPRMPGLMPDNAMVNDDISDTQSESNPHVPNINMQNTPFQNAQVPNQPFVTIYDRSKSGPSLPPSSLNPNNPSINPQSLQQKLMQHKRQQQQQNQSMNSMSPTQGPLTRGQLPNTQVMQQQMAQQQILQQLRLAVQSGLISPQLLNQQLPHNILVLLQQLLQLQNVLQQLVTKQQFLQQNKMMNLIQRQQVEQLAVMINNIKQQILQLQKQLSQAQQILLKNPGGAVGAGGPMAQAPAAGPHIQDSVDNMMPIQNELEKLAINPPQVQQTSRLNQWKRQTPDKETAGEVGENLNKAVGSKPLQQSQSGPSLGPFSDLSGLNISGDTTWSTQATTSSQNWPSTSSGGTTSQAETKESSENKESHPPITTSSTPTISMTDIIPEFVPGKPWQGLTKSVEDDPHITPGSISRSLSVNVVKDDYLNNLATSIKTSPIVAADSSTTWSMKGSHISTTSSSKPWSTSESTTPSMSDVWSMPPKNRPPPGLMAHKSHHWPAGVNRQNSWAGRTDNSAFTPVNAQGWDGRAPNTSTWLVLRNLTPQIDGSTLRTLCQQHGPLRLFHLNLSQGQAVVCYNSKDEAIKAQKALNTCVLGNTTILAEFLSDQECAHFLDQHSNSSNNPSQWSQGQQVSNFQPMQQAPPGQPAAQRSTQPSSAANPGYYRSESTTPWSAMPSRGGMGGGQPGHGNMWSSSLWGGGAVEDHNSNPFLSNILGGESM